MITKVGLLGRVLGEGQDADSRCSLDAIARMYNLPIDTILSAGYMRETVSQQGRAEDSDDEGEGSDGVETVSIMYFYGVWY